MTTDDTWLAALKGANDSGKNWWIACLASLFFGLFGIDRIYLGSYALGFLKFLTGGGICVWWFLDFVFLLSNNMRDAEGGIVRRPF